MANIELIYEGPDGETVIDLSEYPTAKSFEDYYDEDPNYYFYVGPKKYPVEISAEYPEVAWHLADYVVNKGFDFDIVAAVFNDYGFAKGENLGDLPNLEGVLSLCRKYASPSEVAVAYMNAHSVPDLVRDAVNEPKLGESLIGHKALSSKPLIVLWEPDDDAVTAGWG